jgi:hypothetical protein
LAASSDTGGATSDVADPLGLLDGVGDPEKAAFYSTSMDLGRAAQMVSETGIIYEAAKSDAEKMGVTVQEYLKDITGKEVTDSLVVPLSMLHDATVMPWVCTRGGQILY